jgi:hypothetical protein
MIRGGDEELMDASAIEQMRAHILENFRRFGFVVVQSQVELTLGEVLQERWTGIVAAVVGPANEEDWTQARGHVQRDRRERPFLYKIDWTR